MLDPMNPDAMAASVQKEAERVYLSCCAEDLIVVDMEAQISGG